MPAPWSGSTLTQEEWEKKHPKEAKAWKIEVEKRMAKKTEYTFDVIKNGVATFKNQQFRGLPSKTDLDRNEYINTLRNWDNLLSPEKTQWMNDFDFLYIRNAGYMIAKHEIAQRPPGHEILAGVRYDEEGKLMMYNPKEERNSVA